MSCAEQVLRFGPARCLVGITTGQRSRTGIVFLDAGLIHRVGPGRLYVELARMASARGIAALRFDHSGIGDSGVRPDQLPAEKAVVQEAIDALDTLARHAGCDQFILFGMCASTDTAFRAACADRRVAGVVLLNALLGDRATANDNLLDEMTTRKVAHSYLKDKLFRPHSWLRLLRGRTDPRRVLRVLMRAWQSTTRRAQVPLDEDPARVLAGLQGLAARGTRVLLAFGEHTGVRQYFGMTIENRIGGIDPDRRIDVRIVERGDHSFTTLALQREIVEMFTGWLDSFTRSPPPPDDASTAAAPAAGYKVPRRRRVQD
ncbi:MAG: hypothetical protein AB7Q97_06035 [Gammaproteobacteria bacterium]